MIRNEVDSRKNGLIISRKKKYLLAFCCSHSLLVLYVIFSDCLHYLKSILLSFNGAQSSVNTKVWKAGVCNTAAPFISLKQRKHGASIIDNNADSSQLMQCNCLPGHGKTVETLHPNLLVLT